MHAERSETKSIGITLRTTLLSWLVTLVTLSTFVVVIIPEQKRMFLENLRSKAQGAAASLVGVAAGAAVNEDYSSVVDQFTGMLDGDKSIDFLVITKNDGKSQVCQQANPRWRQEDLDVDWRPAQRKPASGIQIPPLFHRRVFQYSQPFDYSGIQWGWIHIGLSLESYDRSVALVYQRTGLLAVLCILLSLAASAVYAKRLVRPILDLQKVVTKVAGGDLSSRAQPNRGDELGSLANSVNAMTEALLRRDRILQSVQYAAQEFLSAVQWQETIKEVLAKLGEAAAASRIRVFANRLEEKDGVHADLCHEWVAAGIRRTLASPPPPSLTLMGADFPLWAQELSHGKAINGNLSQMDEASRQKFAAGGVKAFIAVPIMVEHAWWGILSLVDCQNERQWTEAERDSIRAVADMLGATITRQRTQDALVESKETLEHRVDERTKELQEQVTAKEKAHAELAETQQRLMELSRAAGMAEVATGVLHNVGNVLNSVNVSTTLVCDGIRQSKIGSLVKVAQLLRDHETDLAAFITSDPRGRSLPPMLIHLADHLVTERTAMLDELNLLAKNIGHIKDIVAMQQSYAKVSGITESLSLGEILDDALQMNAAALQRHEIQVIRDYQKVPPVSVDKHKLLQILLNLIRNAKYAMHEKPGSQAKCLRITLGINGDSRVKIAVQDNGIGIQPENLTRIFSHGFTTKKDGHGFGLHMGALAAQGMGGSLSAFSEGPDQGALFVLEFPVTPTGACA